MSKELDEALGEIERWTQKAKQLSVDEAMARQATTTAMPGIPPATMLVTKWDASNIPDGAVCVSVGKMSDTHLKLYVLTPRDRIIPCGSWGIFDITLENGVVKITRHHYPAAGMVAEEPALNFDGSRIVID